MSGGVGWYIKENVRESEGPLERFPSYFKQKGNVRIHWLFETLDDLAGSIGCANNRFDVQRGAQETRLVCTVAPERWPLLKDALDVLAKMDYLPMGGSYGEYGRVKEVTVVPDGRDIRVEIVLSKER